MVSETDIAYIAGLFDGEGHIQYKQYMRKRPHNRRKHIRHGLYAWKWR